MIKIGKHEVGLLVPNNSDRGYFFNETNLGLYFYRKQLMFLKIY